VALGDIAAEEALPALQQARQDGDERVRRAAASALGEIRRAGRRAKAA
jgi:HEAT repeat protein